jgi:hypothetical protein
MSVRQWRRLVRTRSRIRTSIDSRKMSTGCPRDGATVACRFVKLLTKTAWKEIAVRKTEAGRDGDRKRGGR